MYVLRLYGGLWRCNCGQEQEYRPVEHSKRLKSARISENRPVIGWKKARNPKLRGSTIDLIAEGVVDKYLHCAKSLYSPLITYC